MAAPRQQIVKLGVRHCPLFKLTGTEHVVCCLQLPQKGSQWLITSARGLTRARDLADSVPLPPLKPGQRQRCCIVRSGDFVDSTHNVVMWWSREPLVSQTYGIGAFGRTKQIRKSSAGKSCLHLDSGFVIDLKCISLQSLVLHYRGGAQCHKRTAMFAIWHRQINLCTQHLLLLSSSSPVPIVS